MDLAIHINGRGGIWRPAEPAEAAQLEKLRAQLPSSVPNAYFDLLRFSNGGEGDLGVEPGWFCPWSAEEVLVNNAGYRVAEFYGQFLGFGSNGGGELIAFDCRVTPPWPIIMIPFIGGTEHCERIADDFDAFLANIGRPLEHTREK
jgi:hypothetical protein